MAERRALAAQLTAYLAVIPPEERALPGFPGTPSKWERHGHGRQHTVQCKKKACDFPIPPTGMPLTKLSLAGIDLIIPGQGESLVSDILTGDGKAANLF
jgi:hypothetical protein